LALQCSCFILRKYLIEVKDKQYHAAELLLANKELLFQNEDKENRAAELIIANEELYFQNQEKEDRAAELIVANRELLYQNEEKENRAAELIIANEELSYQNQEKENRAAELIIANKELSYQNEEKEKRAAELVLANKELSIQNTEIKLLEEQREFDSNNLSALINNTPDLMWSIDRDFNLITSNVRFHEMVKLMSGKDIKKGDTILSNQFPPEQLERFKQFYERTFAGETFREQEYSPPPFEFWTDTSYAPIYNGGEIIGTVCHSRDVTETRLAELDRLSMVNDLMLRNKDLEQFAYIISHNLRAPVANIIGASDALNDKDLSKADREILSKGIGVSVMRLDGVVQDLNRILQVKSQVNEHKEIVIFSELVEDIKISIKNMIDKYNVTVKYDFSAIDEFITLKPYLYSIFYNLINNSVKYCKQDLPCIIEIKSRQEANNLQLFFIDNGTGIDLEKKGGEVFGLYKKFHESGEGKGVGLYMVKTQVEALGGRISIQSEKDMGTEFKIEFNLSSAPEIST
jgi:PAS domain S-box-containing protein